MISFKDYNKNVNEILEHANIEKSYFDKLFKIYSGEDVNVDITELTETIIKKLFSVYGQEQPNIPYSFFETPVGKILMNVKFHHRDEKYYNVQDVSTMAGISRQQVIKDIHSGLIYAEKIGRDWQLKKEDIDNYLIRRERKAMKKEKLYKYGTEKIYSDESKNKDEETPQYK